jgi:flagellar biosynthesis component FlhA
VRGDEEGTRFLEKIAAVVKAHLEHVKASLDRQIASEDGKTHIVELDPTVDPIVENIINDSTESEPETEFEVLNEQPQYKPL